MATPNRFCLENSLQSENLTVIQVLLAEDPTTALINSASRKLGSPMVNHKLESPASPKRAASVAVEVVAFAVAVIVEVTVRVVETIAVWMVDEVSVAVYSAVDVAVALG